MARHSDIRSIEVFRPGSFTPMGGTPIAFSADDLRAIASAYDPDGAPAPAVVGHPSVDAPAYAWAKSFSFDEVSQRLIADLGEIEPAFADQVAAGRYRKVSLSLFSPDAPNNPKPGAWYPRHVGFLGAAAPAVPGLRTVSFAAAAEGVLTFEFADATALRDVAGLFRTLREWLIEKFGSETADKALPNWTIAWIDDAAERDPAAVPAFAAPAASAPETRMTQQTPAATADELARRQTALDAREREANHKDHVAFAEGLVEAGRLIPVLKEKVVALLDGLSPTGGTSFEVSFSEGGAAATQPARELLMGILEAQPKVVSFGALTLPAEPGAAIVDFALPEGALADAGSAALHARAVAWQAAHPGTDYMAAVAAVNR